MLFPLHLVLSEPRFMTLNIAMSFMSRRGSFLGRKSDAVGEKPYKHQAKHHIHGACEHVNQMQKGIIWGVLN